MDKCYTPSCISSNECVFHPRKAYFKADEDSHQPLKDTSAFLNDILELQRGILVTHDSLTNPGILLLSTYTLYSVETIT